jgi:hypothetical protein
MRIGAVVLLARRRLGSALGLVGGKAQVQHEDGEWQADETREFHNWIVNREPLETEPPCYDDPCVPRAGRV